MKLSFRPIYLACLAACACGAAQAQSSVTLYGIAAVEAVHVTGVNGNGVIAKRNYLDNSQVTSSRIGFKGAEDLGGGLSAVFGLEAGIGLDTGTAGSTFWGRGTFVGLSSTSFGTLTFGRQWNLSDAINGTYFIYGGYSVFRFAEFGFISDLVNNSAKYVSPVFAGLQVSALVAAGEGTTGRTYELGADYKMSGFQVGATYRNAENFAGTADKLATIGASYVFGPARIHGGFAAANLPASFPLTPKARAYDIGVVYTVMPQLQATLDYVVRDQRNTDNDSKFVRLGAEYSVSKRTIVFANLVGLRNDGTAAAAFYGSGAAGQDQNLFSLGLRHMF